MFDPTPFYTKIALKMLGQKLIFDVFATARSIFSQLYDSHRKLN